MVPCTPIVPVILNDDLHRFVRKDLNIFGLLKCCHDFIAFLARIVDLGDIKPEVVVKLLELFLTILLLLQFGLFRNKEGMLSLFIVSQLICADSSILPKAWHAMHAFFLHLSIKRL